MSDEPDKLYYVNRKKAFTDTGANCIVGPTHEMTSIREMLVSKLSYYATWTGWGEVFFCSERDNLPSLFFLYGDYWIEVRPIDYAIQLTDGSYSTDGAVCGFCFSTSDFGYWVLGTTFLKGLYSIHDYENMRFGFVSVDDGVSVPKQAPTLAT